MFLETVLHVVRGLLIGAADVVPGVSGGTMAFIIGIYARLIGAVRRFDWVLLQLLWRGQLRIALGHVDAPLLIPLGLGIVLALFFFTRVVSLPTLLRTHPELVYALFFGLIAGSIKVLLGSNEGRGLVRWWWFAGGVLVGLVLVTRIPITTPDAAWFIFLCGLVAIGAMMLPGISGSFVLLLLHKYEYVFTAIGQLQLSILLPFMLGAATGMLVFSRVLTWLLMRCYTQALHLIGGLLLGSLWLVWPFQVREYTLIGDKERLLASSPVLPPLIDREFWWVCALMGLGFVTVVVIERLARRYARTARG